MQSKLSLGDMTEFQQSFTFVLLVVLGLSFPSMGFAGKYDCSCFELLPKEFSGHKVTTDSLNLLLNTSRTRQIIYNSVSAYEMGTCSSKHLQYSAEAMFRISDFESGNQTYSLTIQEDHVQTLEEDLWHIKKMLGTKVWSKSVKERLLPFQECAVKQIRSEYPDNSSMYKRQLSIYIRSSNFEKVTDSVKSLQQGDLGGSEIGWQMSNMVEQFLRIGESVFAANFLKMLKETHGLATKEYKYYKDLILTEVRISEKYPKDKEKRKQKILELLPEILK